MTGVGDYAIGSGHWPGVSKLIEEMGELGQVLGKLMATSGEAEHWDGSDLRQRLVEEVADVKAAITFVASRNLTKAEVAAIDKRAVEKFAVFTRWHQEQGT